MPWLVEWTSFGTCEANSTIWSSEWLAYKACCADMLYSLANDSGHYLADNAQTLNDLVMQTHYKECVDLWNEYTDASHDYEHKMYWRVYRVVEDPFPVNIGFLNFPKKAEIKSTKIEAVVSAGATCRGCSTYSPDAYSDRSDGTHACYACRTYCGVV